MAVRVGVASGDFGWGVLPVVMLTHSLRSVASITTGYSEATLREGGAIGGERGIGSDWAVWGFGSDRGLGDSGGIIILYNEGVS